MKTVARAGFLLLPVLVWSIQLRLSIATHGGVNETATDMSGMELNSSSGHYGSGDFISAIFDIHPVHPTQTQSSTVPTTTIAMPEQVPTLSPLTSLTSSKYTPQPTTVTVNIMQTQPPTPHPLTSITSSPLPSTTETTTVYTTVVVPPSHTRSVDATPSHTMEITTTDSHTMEGITSHTEGDIECSNQASSSNGTSIALGIVVGLLTLLLTAVIIASVAIIFTIQSKRVTKANRATIPNAPNLTTTSHNITLRRFSNPMYEGDTLLPIRRPSPSSGDNVLAPHTQEAGGHMYEAIKPPTGMSNRRSLDSSRRESVQQHTQDSVKVTSREVRVERQGSRTLEEYDIENHYHLLEPEEGRSPEGENRDKENRYHLVWQEDKRSKDGESRDRESDYHLLGQEDGMRDEGENKDQESDYHLLGQEDERNLESNQVDADRDKENHYHLVEQESEKSQHEDRESDYHILGQEDKGSQDGDTESDYHLLSDVNVEAETTEGRAEAIYHVIETPGNDDNDYEDPDDGNLFLSSVPGPYSRPSVHYHGASRIKTDNKLTRSSHT